MTDKTLFRFFVENTDLVTFLRKQGEFTSWIIKLLEDYRGGKLVTVGKMEIEVKIKEQRLKKLTAEASIKELELKYWQTFHKTPTFQSHLAIKENISNKNSFRELTEQEINLIVKLITLENTFDGWRVTCLDCRLEVSYKDRLEALNEAARHLSAVHGKKILAK